MNKTINADLRILLIEVTQKCNARCDQCGSRCDIHSEELLTKEEILSALADIKENLGTDAMINITGGEPLLRGDLFEMMTEVTSMGFDWGMVTNGSLITDEVIAKMKASGLKTITISLDGLKKTHESLRHLPGSFDRILWALKKLREADFLDHIQVTFTSNRRNFREFPALYEELEKIGIDSVRTSFMDPIGRAALYEELLLRKNEMEFLMDFTNRMNRERRLPIIWGCCHFLDRKVKDRSFFCFTGIYAASILYNGDIFVCPNVERRPELIQGNIKKDSISRVWREGFIPFRDRHYPDACRKCRYFARCRADSFHTYDFDGDRPKFCYAEIFEKEKRRWLFH